MVISLKWDVNPHQTTSDSEWKFRVAPRVANQILEVSSATPHPSGSTTDLIVQTCHLYKHVTSSYIKYFNNVFNDKKHNLCLCTFMFSFHETDQIRCRECSLHSTSYTFFTWALSATAGCRVGGNSSWGLCLSYAILYWFELDTLRPSA